MNLDPDKPMAIDADLTGMNINFAMGETLSAPAVDSVNTFTTPNIVVPKPIAASVKGGTLTLTVEPKSMTVIALEQ
jgi:alpha-N-arabinofuranosidase